MNRSENRIAARIDRRAAARLVAAAQGLVAVAFDRDVADLRSANEATCEDARAMMVAVLVQHGELAPDDVASLCGFTSAGVEGLLARQVTQLHAARHLERWRAIVAAFGEIYPPHRRPSAAAARLAAERRRGTRARINPSAAVIPGIRPAGAWHDEIEGGGDA